MLLAFAALLAAMQTTPAPSDRVALTVSERCDLEANGKPIRITELRAAAEQWERDARELHLKPDALAPYECVDAVLAQLKAANFTRLGFVGNEMYVSENVK